MIPLVDLHCHLLAGLDDGPRTEEDALAMARIAHREGVQLAAATAHQNEHWSSVTPEQIRQATHTLSQKLRSAGIPLTVFPCAEVMVRPDIEALWVSGALLSVADRQQYLLIELPHRLFVDLRHTVRQLRRAGVRPILAHPERQAELLHEAGQIEQLIQAGCLVQVCSGSITDARTRQDAWAIRRWFKRGIVHVLGSDGHSPTRRPPTMADAYRQITRWAGSSVANRVCSTNGMAVLQGLPLHAAEPEPRSFRWMTRLWS